MRFIKAIIVLLLASLAFAFVNQNIEVLKHTIQLRLNLYFVNLETPPLDLWVLIVLAFALGAVLVLIYFIIDHFRQKRVIRQLKQNIEFMAMQLKQAGVAIEDTSTLVTASSPLAESKEQPIE